METMTTEVTTIRTPWNTATGYVPCPDCMGRGFLPKVYEPRPGQARMFAACDEIKMLVRCATCQGNSRILEADEADARANMLAFVRRLPLIEDCDFAQDGDSDPWRCEFQTPVAGYEGRGTSPAAAYGQMIGFIVEREA